MDKKILMILVGTLCFGLGVGTGIGMMALKDMERQKTPIQQEQSKEKPGKENEVEQPKLQLPEVNKEPIAEKEMDEEKNPEIKVPSQEQSGVEGWQANTNYSIGHLVSYDNKLYKCIQAHTALDGWEPHVTPALWGEVE